MFLEGWFLFSFLESLLVLEVLLAGGKTWCRLYWDSKACQETCDIIRQWSQWSSFVASLQIQAILLCIIIHIIFSGLWIKPHKCPYLCHYHILNLHSELILGWSCIWEDLTNWNGAERGTSGSLSWWMTSFEKKSKEMNQKANWQTEGLEEMKKMGWEHHGNGLYVLNCKRIKNEVLPFCLPLHWFGLRHQDWMYSRSFRHNHSSCLIHAQRRHVLPQPCFD